MWHIVKSVKVIFIHIFNVKIFFLLVAHLRHKALSHSLPAIQAFCLNQKERRVALQEEELKWLATDTGTEDESYKVSLAESKTKNISMETTIIGLLLIFKKYLQYQ